MNFTDIERAACQHLVELALQEDLGSAGDLTSQAVIHENLQGRAVFHARKVGVLSGLSAAELVVQAVDPTISFEPLVRDGSMIHAGQALARVQGRMRGILSAERTALNFLQRLSGVATQTRHFVDAVAGLSAQILDTRKTTPGWRLLEKYAVRCGGGANHRMGLHDGVLIKDNHLEAEGHGATKPIRLAVEQARVSFGKRYPIEVEVDTLDELDQALQSEVDVILLDNMTLEQMREAVNRRNSRGRGTRLEASGGVTLATIRSIAETGVDRISVGALTHSAPALDIALDYEKEPA